MPQHETAPSPRGAPERTCILTGEPGARAGLIRLALGPDGRVLPDLGARAPGRGAWIKPDRTRLATAVAKGQLKGALSRAFKTRAITVPDGLVELIEDGLKRRALDRLGLEMRAGHLILGTDRIAEACRMGRVALLLHASDAAADGNAKLDAKLRGSGRGVSTMLPTGRADLSLALGRENVVHAAVGNAAAADRVAAAVERWRAFSGMEVQSADGDRPMSAQTRYQGPA